MKKKLYKHLKKTFLIYNDMDEIDENQHAFVSLDKINEIMKEVFEPLNK